MRKMVSNMKEEEGFQKPNSVIRRLPLCKFDKVYTENSSTLRK